MMGCHKKDRLLARLNNYVYLDYFRLQRLSHFHLLTKIALPVTRHGGFHISGGKPPKNATLTDAILFTPPKHLKVVADDRFVTS